MHRFVEETSEFAGWVQLRSPQQALGSGRVVFEGAQGLALDEELGAFPHVTRSMTGLPYVVEACREAGIKQVDVHYGTRAYTTRHGAGPMAFEDGVMPPGFVDATNQPNAFQGSLRFSPLQLTYMAQLVAQDMARVDTSGLDLRMGMWVSCMDQMGERVPVAGRASIALRELPDALQQALGAQWVSVSHGPCREHVRLADAINLQVDGLAPLTVAVRA